MFPQTVFAEMTRFADHAGNWYMNDKKDCYMVRNKTKIEFGKADNLIGIVIMTNPGSYGLDRIVGWKDFKRGNGKTEILKGEGFPDPTMQNVISVILSAYERKQISMPNGFIDVLNISSVVCANGENVLDYHEVVKKLIRKHNLDPSCLEDIRVHGRSKLSNIFEESPFVILGFVQKVFDEKVKEIMKLSSDFPNKAVVAKDKNNWPTHPYRWRADKWLKEEAISELVKVI